jgi:type III pantothenate kinase
MSNLIIDRGNHATKVHLYQDGKMMNAASFKATEDSALFNHIQSQSYSACILCSVRADDDELTTLIAGKKLIRFTHKTPIPIRVSYATPESLGPDRIAGALAGWQLSEGGNVLTIIAGTCITYNIVESGGVFTGGAISPGLHMRLKAMHEFTGRLPLVSMKGEYPLTANTTESSLRSGALNGAIREVSGMISSYGAIYPNLKTVISGGDGTFLAEALKNGIFARPNLVAEGLNTILKYNVAHNVAD